MRLPPPSAGIAICSTWAERMSPMKTKAAAPAARRSTRNGTSLSPLPLERPENPAVDLGRTARRLRESQNLTLADHFGK